jgi:hypothetical protein
VHIAIIRLIRLLQLEVYPLVSNGPILHLVLIKTRKVEDLNRLRLEPVVEDRFFHYYIIYNLKNNNNKFPFLLKLSQRSRNQYLTSICLLSHHPFFTLFRECLVVLKKLIDACHENSSPKRLGASRLTSRFVSIPIYRIIEKKTPIKTCFFFILPGIRYGDC